MADSNIINGVTFITGLTLNEVLVKTSYFVQSNKPGDKEFQGKPEAYGTGFMVLYKGRTFFVTADHVAHVKDHDLKKRTGENNVVGVHTYTRKELSAQVILLSESFFAENYNIKTGKCELVDVCVTQLTPEQLYVPFFTPEVEIPERIIQKGEQMIIFPDDIFAQPCKEDTYYVCGHTRPHIKNGIFIEYEKAFKSNLKFMLRDGDHLLFNTEEVITDYEDWAGISGAPIMNQEGKCAGIVTSVNVDSKMVWGYTVETITMLMESLLSDLHTKSPLIF